MDKIITFPKKTLQSKGRLLDFSSPKIMGILNLNEDSFYEKSRQSSISEACHTAEKMLKDGAYLLDLGAMSSRPGAQISNPEEESKQILPYIEAIRENFPECFISIDTVHSKVANEAIDAGADLINDISGGNIDPEIFKVIANKQTPYVLMHMRGTPETMQSLTQYDNFLAELQSYFNEKIEALKRLNIHDIIIDPGFGFAKTIEQNFYLLKKMELFSFTGFPILAGLSRKSMIWKTLECRPEEALNGTSALNMLALNNGASLLRVHDVKEAKECIYLYEQYKNASA